MRLGIGLALTNDHRVDREREIVALTVDDPLTETVTESGDYWVSEADDGSEHVQYEA